MDKTVPATRKRTAARPVARTTTEAVQAPAQATDEDIRAAKQARRLGGVAANDVEATPEEIADADLRATKRARQAALRGQ